MIRPAKKHTICEDVLKQMISAVKEGAWKPGERIPSEAELADRFRVGRNSIREAMKSLTLYNVMESRPGLGTFISSDAMRSINNAETLKMFSDISSTSSFVELMEIRMLLEVQMASWAAQLATTDDIAELRNLLNIQRTLKYPGGTLPEKELLPHARFHERIWRIGRNRLARKLLYSIQDEIYQHRQRYLDLPSSGWGQMIDEHAAIIKCIEKHDSASAEERMRRHIISGIRRVQKNGF